MPVFSSFLGKAIVGKDKGSRPRLQPVATLWLANGRFQRGKTQLVLLKWELRWLVLPAVSKIEVNGTLLFSSKVKTYVSASPPTVSDEPAICWAY